MTKKFGFITSNSGKLLELQKRFLYLGNDVQQVQLEYPEIQADTIDEVSEFGLTWIISQLRSGNYGNLDEDIIKELDFLIVEDSGLFVHALNDFPGVYSKFIFKSIGYSGILKLLLDVNDRSAHFESCFGLAELENFLSLENVDHGIDDINIGSKNIKLFKGVVSGEIVNEPRGEHGFGYDPIFRPKGVEKTFAEMETDVKNQFSHRGKALLKMIEYLK